MSTFNMSTARESTASLGAFLNASGGFHNWNQAEREMREELGTLCDECEALMTKAQAEKREFTSAEQQQYGAAMARVDEIRPQLTGTAQAKDAAMHKILQMGDGSPTEPAQATGWVDQHGKPVHVLAKGQKFVDLPTKNADLCKGSIGEYIQARITGDHSRCSPVIKGALKEGDNSLGGFLVPAELGRRVIDLARAQSVLMKAGCQTVGMTSDTLTLARVASDPTFVVVGENVAITESSMTFDALNFSAYKIATFIAVSRELAEDAPNFVQLVESTLAQAFAAKLDNIGINGMTPGIDSGLLQMATSTGMGETTGVGGILWEDLHGAVVGIQGQNFEPNGYIVNPEIAGDLATLTTGDGTNSAKMWLPPPATVAGLTQHRTTNIPNTSIVVGDFSQAVWAIRHNARLEMSLEAGEAFTKHQVYIKLVWRGDFGAFRRNAFHRLVGITT